MAFWLLARIDPPNQGFSEGQIPMNLPITTWSYVFTYFCHGDLVLRRFHCIKYEMEKTMKKWFLLIGLFKIYVLFGNINISCPSSFICAFSFLLPIWDCWCVPRWSAPFSDLEHYDRRDQHPLLEQSPGGQNQTMNGCLLQTLVSLVNNMF